MTDEEAKAREQFRARTAGLSPTGMMRVALGDMLIAAPPDLLPRLQEIRDTVAAMEENPALDPFGVGAAQAVKEAAELFAQACAEGRVLMGFKVEGSS